MNSMRRVSEYDNEVYFNQYAQMPRSREGLPLWANGIRAFRAATS